MGKDRFGQLRLLYRRGAYQFCVQTKLRFAVQPHLRAGRGSMKTRRAHASVGGLT